MSLGACRFVSLTLLYISLGRPQDVVLVLKSMYPGVLFGCLTLLAVFVGPRDEERQRVNVQEHLWITCLVVLMAINTLFSNFPGNGVEVLNEFFKQLVLYAGLTRFLRTRDDFDAMACVMLLVCVTLAMPITLGGILPGVRMSVGSFYDPNDLAMILTVCLPFALYLFHLGSVRTKVIAAAAVAVVIPAIIATQSRMGFLALIILGLLYVARGVSRKVGFSTRALVGALSVILVVGIASAQYWERINTLLDEDNTGAGRTVVWKRGLQIALENPLLGVGPGAFPSVYGRMLRAGEFELVGDSHVDHGWKSAHNSYLLVLVELGFPGLFVFLGLCISSMARLVRIGIAYKKDSVHAYVFEIARVVEIALSIFLFCAFFLSLSWSPVLLSLLAAGILIRKIAHAEAEVPALGVGVR